MNLTKHIKGFAATVGVMAVFAIQVRAGAITAAVFATGSPISSTSPDSVVFGDGSLWVSYQNGADTTGASGSSTVVRYSPSGSIINTWTIAGNVDGLRIDPNGQVWALQNNDGNSALTVINPVTNATTPYTYGSSYTNSANRGFDDAEFLNGQVYLSETNPAGGTDPVIVTLTTPLESPLQITGVLNSTFTGLNLATGIQASTTITDSDSLILDPSGNLVLTGEADQEVVFVRNPGTVNQTESFVMLLGTNGQTISGLPDDTVFPTSANGTFYVADTGANTVYALTATGLAAGSVYIDVGDIFGQLDTSTGIVTPLFTGVSPHGVVFVSNAPETPSFFLVGGALLMGAAFVLNKRRRLTVME
jgi:sugar lactone lactonase YvrE